MSNYPMARVLPTRYTSDENDWYDPIDNETMVLNPEWIAFGKESFTVTQDMVKEENDNYGKPRTSIKDKFLVATLVPQNIIYTLHISVHVRGIDNYKAGRAVITGMADGYFPGREEYSPKLVTHFAEDWSIKEKSINTDGIWEGTITTEITCFGLPMGHAGDSKDNILRLSLLLIDDKTLVNRMFYVGDKFHRKTIDESSLHLYLDLKLSDELPNVAPAQNTGQSGFDATVDEWGEEENSEIIM